MLLVANGPILPAFPKNPMTGWINCGDPVPSPQAPYVYIPYPAGSDTVLAVQPDGTYETVPMASAGPKQYMQLNGNCLECEQDGAIVIPCRPGLV